MIEGVVSDVLQSRVPPAMVDNTVFPQLSDTDTTGIAGIVLGDTIADPGALVQPFTVCVTLYDPGVSTVMLLVVSPLIHNKEPGAVVDKVELPQLFETVTSGVAGVTSGAATPEPGWLLQPSAVWVTV